MRYRNINGVVCAVALAAAAGQALATISYTGIGSFLNEDFDTLATSGTGNAWANDSTITGWSLFNQTPAAITTYNAGTGSSNAGSFYSFGVAGENPETDRALGGVGSGGTYFGGPSSGSVAGWIAVGITNNTGSTLDWWGIEYVGEQWRNGNASAQTMVFEYGYGATFDAVASWTAPGAAWDFTSPVFGGTAGALDGNDPANRVSGIGDVLFGQTWTPGQTLWMRWIELNDTGSDHGLAIDEWAFRSAPAPGALALLGMGGLMASRRRR